MEYKHNLLNDRWVIEDVYRGMKKGFFLEAGAANGVNGSATYVLEREFGWDGICVEPIERAFQGLRRWRHCKVDNRALYSESRFRLEFEEVHGRSGLSGLSAHLRASTRELGRTPGMVERLLKETVTLYDLLVQHDAPHVIHYFCLDVEGSELQILEGFPFDRPFKILALSIEGRRCEELMIRNRYRPVKNPHTEKTFEHYYLHEDIDKYLSERRPNGG